MLDLDPQTRTWLLAGLSGIAVSGGVFVTNALLRILSDTQRKTTASSLAAKATKHTGTSELQSNPSPDSQAAATDVVHVFYASQKGHGKRFAERLVLDLQRVDVAAEAINLKAFDPDRLVEHTKAIFIVATYAGGSAVPGTEGFFSELAEMSRDFRVEKTLLSALQYAVFGCGNSEYPAKDFNAVARRLDRSLRLLGAKRLLARCEGDDIDNALSEQFDAWSPKLLRAVEASLGKGKGGGEGASKRTARRVERLRTQGALDAAKAEAGATKRKEEAERERALRSGYKIVGSHSGVKICRWTKAMLRGRGGCYKHTFYGIVSYQCMEATPSLACANKCVFCWRHHDNPVGTSFRWQVNHPTELVDGFEEKHKAMIKQMKGVPGVKPERYAEACKTVRHCALSLVGEPIIYPRINELLATLHKRGISSFMVTNAQFPAQMETLSPCTQLYISVDAPNAPELKAVDRPLFPDFWQRFLECVDLLRAKRQRTVFRMTLVNGWNTEQLSQYVELVKRGQPDFVEVKGVTYCGDSKASPLSIKHCPFHHEVRAYGQAMVAELGADYELASEHAHSNIILIAHRRFKVDGAWRTWIDYDKFTALANSGEPFDSLDYSLPTPPWAVFDEAAEDGGFDPGETRFIRKGGATTVTGGGC